MSEPQDTTRRLAGLLRAHYGTAVRKAGWTPGWEDDAERILAALEVVPASQSQEATEALRWVWRFSEDAHARARARAALDSLGEAQPQTDATSEKPSPPATAGGSEAPGGPSLDGSGR